MKRTWTDQQLIEAVRDSKSYSGVTRKLGISAGSGGAIANIKPHIERLGLDLSHWTFDPIRTETTKRCSICEEFKLYEDFHKATKSKDGRNSYCKDCQREKSRAWEWAKKHGLTLEQYEKKLELQNGLCAICLKAPNGGRWNRLYVDHRHSDGAPRGLLCSTCNLALGMFGDSPDRLDQAAEYLRRW